MIKAAILAIGSELLEGSIVDTNSAYIGDKLTRNGVDVVEVRLIPDDMERMVSAFRDVAEQVDIVLCTGGLGPTFDDLTAEALATASEQEFVLMDNVLEHISARLATYGITVKDNHRHQAYRPANCYHFHNSRGTALGFGVDLCGAAVICMPGIPAEMYGMLEDEVLPYLRTRFSLQETHRLDIRLAGLGESAVDDAVTSIGVPEGVTCIINVGKGECFVKLRSAQKELLTQFADIFVPQMKDYFIGFGSEGLADIVLRMLRERKLTLAVAESCTGGGIGKEITAVSGSSDVFLGGILSYSDDLKRNLLGVPAEMIQAHGAVSEETCRAMLIGAQKATGAGCAIAVTGIAGPGGGTAEKPVGLVYVGVACGDKITVKHNQFSGDREAIRERTIKVALRLLQTELREV